MRSIRQRTAPPKDLGSPVSRLPKPRLLLGVCAFWLAAMSCGCGGEDGASHWGYILVADPASPVGVFGEVIAVFVPITSLQTSDSIIGGDVAVASVPNCFYVTYPLPESGKDAGALFLGFESQAMTLSWRDSTGIYRGSAGGPLLDKGGWTFKGGAGPIAPFEGVVSTPPEPVSLKSNIYDPMTHELHVTWVPGNATRMVLVPLIAGDASVACDVDDAVGIATIPEPVLSGLFPFGTVPHTLLVMRIREEEHGDWSARGSTVVLAASSTSLFSDPTVGP